MNSQLADEERLRRSRSSESSFKGSNASSHSKIPVKSPLRSSASIGGLAVAYSPRSNNGGPSSSSPNTPKSAYSSPVSNSSSANESYERKMRELKSAMDLLKTPPALKKSTDPLFPSDLQRVTSNSDVFEASQTDSTPSFSHSEDDDHQRNIYSPILNNLKGSGGFFEACKEERVEPCVEISHHASPAKSLVREHAMPELSTPNNGLFHNQIIQNSSATKLSSPYISAEELKLRLEATKEAFQRSLLAQRQEILPIPTIDEFTFPPSHQKSSLQSNQNVRSRVQISFDELDSEFYCSSADESMIKESVASEPNLNSSRLEIFLKIFTIIFGVLILGIGMFLADQWLKNVDLPEYIRKFEDLLNYWLQDSSEANSVTND